MSTFLLRFLGRSIMFILLLLPSFSRAQVSGAIATDTTWTGTVTADSVYVPSGRTLTVQPGTIVKFNAGKMLVVAGKLLANGTSANKITFTSNAGSPAPGNWNGIELQNSADVNSVINYCIVEYAGGGSNASNIFYRTGAPNINITNSIIRLSSNHGVNPRSASPRISTTTLRQNAGYGVYADLSLSFVVDSCTVSSNTTGGILIGVNSTATVTNCAVDSNGTGIFIGNSAAPTVQKNNIRRNNIGIQFTGVGATQPTISQDTITNNTTWGFLNTSTTTTVRARQNYWGNDTGPFHSTLNPTGLGDKISNNVDFQPWVSLAPALPVIQVTGNIAKDSTWPSGVFWIKNSISVNSGFRLTINGGVIVKFAPGARLTVNGSINASGTTNNRIVFTSEKEDSYGGDSNGDGGATIAGRGDWDMVYLSSGQNNTSVLNYCLFKFGGSSSSGNFYVYNCSPVISNVTSNQSSNYGMYANSSSATITNSTFGSNSSHGILFDSSPLTIYGSTISNNGSYGLYARGSSHFTVRKSTLTYNTYGIVADGGAASATLVSLDSSIISFNTSAGIYCWYGTGPQTFAYNRIESNGAGYGLWVFNVDNLVTIVGDTILTHGQEGIVTSKASITNNVIQNNRYPIALVGRANTTYSSNTISGNLHNNALAIRLNRSDESLSDTLSATFPSGMTSKTYVVIDNTSGMAVNSGQTLVIQPGVIIKMDVGAYFRVDGTLIADGTSSNPIVFTSYRDASYGGKTNLASDNTAPAPGDWRYVRIRTAGSNATILNNVIFKYGGMDNVGNLWIESSVVLTNPISNIISRKSSTMGIRIGDSQITFNNATVDSNSSYGIYVEGNRPSDITVRNSFILDNNGTGLRTVNNSTFREVSNCQIKRNNGWGIGTDNGTLPQRFQGNTITHNANGGIYNDSPSLTSADLQYVGNTVTDHPTDDGILSTAARFIDNILQRNKYPIGMWGRLGNIYTDNTGIDGNVISANTYNAISLRGAGSQALSDTLKNVFPLGIPSKTYVAIQHLYINGGTTLVIQPGVILKFSGYFYFLVYGTMLANGTSANPIVFTSWRDSTIGGKTVVPTDYTPPAPGDWYYVNFINGSGASIVRYCQFKYGGRDNQQTVHLDANLSTLKFSNNLVRKSMAAGIYMNNTAVTIDSTTVDSCTYHGIRANGNPNNNLILRYSKINNNGNYGVWIQNGSKLSVLLNCDISRNTYTGVYVENNSVPLSVIGNTVNNNSDHGMYLIAQNDAIDSLLTVAGNKIRNNGLAGLFSSRAYISDDSITGNRYGIGLVGQTSLTGTGTANGNVFQNNVVTGNRFSTFVMEGTIFGKIGYSFLPGDTNKVIAVRGDAFVSSGSTLTIAPGTVVKFPLEYGNGRLEVQGVLKSEGTTNKKIIYTSWKDDTYGGDSNADSNATVPNKGDWDMVWLNGAGSSTSHVFNSIIRFGGRTNYGDLRLDGNSAPIDSSFISYSSSNGIIMYSSNSPITGCEIHSNNASGITTQNSSNPVIHFNIIRDNAGYGLYHNTSSTLDAINNYWGASSGPLVNSGSDLNLTGTGNKIQIAFSGPVIYKPFLTSRTGVLLGDVSLNGTISPFDASLILRHLAATLSPALTSTQLAAADVSGDATVSALDASYILRYVTGLITGFPGLGKVVTNSAVASAFEFKTQTGTSSDEIQFVLALKKTVPIYAIELQLSFDSTLVSVVDINKTPFTDKMMIESNIKSDRAAIIMAAMYPLTEEGDAVKAIFRVKNTAKGMGTIRIERFVLNEMNLTDEAEREARTLKTTAQIPTEFSLGQNYPNPFNPSTTIAYQLPTTSTVTIKIYDLLGQEIRSFVNAEQKPGVYTVMWDGKNTGGQTVATNVYFYRIEATSADQQRFVQVKKMLLLK